MNYTGSIKIFKENSHILYTQIVDKIYYFVFWTLLARSLLPDLYGSIIIVFTSANLMVTLFGFGLPIHIQREAALNPQKGNEGLTSIFSVNLLLLIPFSIISVIIFMVVYPSSSIESKLLLLVLFAFISNELLLTGILKGQQKYSTIFSITAVLRIITIVVFFIVYMFWNNSFGIIYTFLAGNFLFIIILSFASGQFPGGLKFSNIRFGNFTKLIIVVFPLWLATVFNFLYDRIDVFLISKLVSLEQLSFYSIAYGVMKSSTIAFSFMLVGGLTKATSYSGDKIEMRNFIVKYSKLFLVISSLILIMLLVFADILLVFLYTDKYSESALILRVLAFAIIPLSLNNLTGTALNGAGMYKENLYITIIGFLFNLTANLFVIPVSGIIGAAFVTIVTEIIILTGDFAIIKYKGLA
ncbi:MAG: polysaccharide biosynthesis C-terminal domain-containing protein [Ignavibacteria bacterium]